MRVPLFSVMALVIAGRVVRQAGLHCDGGKQDDGSAVGFLHGRQCGAQEANRTEEMRHDPWN